jgi:hypothetical protein
MNRIDRNRERAARAGRNERRQGLGAMDTAKAMIEAAFDESAAHIDFKARVAAVLAGGPDAPANKLRYRARARMLSGKSLGTAIVAAERWYKAERKAFQIVSVYGRPPQVSLMILAELRLILRFFRRRGMARQFPALVDSLLQLRSQRELLTAAE